MNRRQTSLSISLPFGGRVLVHFIALRDTRVPPAPVPDILETYGGRCGTYGRDIFIIWSV